MILGSPQPVPIGHIGRRASDLQARWCDVAYRVVRQATYEEWLAQDLVLRPGEANEVRHDYFYEVVMD